MSYCRTGVDSDVYLFRGHSCLVLHVAWNRGPIAPNPGLKATDEDVAKWILGPALPFDHPFAGETFKTKSRQQMIAKLEIIRMLGGRVPQDAIDRLNREIEEEGDEYAWW